MKEVCATFGKDNEQVMHLAHELQHERVMLSCCIPCAEGMDCSTSSLPGGSVLDASLISCFVLASYCCGASAVDRNLLHHGNCSFKPLKGLKE